MEYLIFLKNWISFPTWFFSWGNMRSGPAYCITELRRHFVLSYMRFFAQLTGVLPTSIPIQNNGVYESFFHVGMLIRYTNLRGDEVPSLFRHVTHTRWSQSLHRHVYYTLLLNTRWYIQMYIFFLNGCILYNFLFNETKKD